MRNYSLRYGAEATRGAFRPKDAPASDHRAAPDVTGPVRPFHPARPPSTVPKVPNDRMVGQGTGRCRYALRAGDRHRAHGSLHRAGTARARRAGALTRCRPGRGTDARRSGPERSTSWLVASAADGGLGHVVAARHVGQALVVPQYGRDDHRSAPLAAGSATWNGSPSEGAPAHRRGGSRCAWTAVDRTGR